MYPDHPNYTADLEPKHLLADAEAAEDGVQHVVGVDGAHHPA
jgi:hypothetical protein